MLPIWTTIKQILSFVTKNWGWIASVIMVLFIFLFFDQCKATKIARAETDEAKLIADNNLKALTDSTIVLQVTRGQLSLIDKNLSKITRELDSLKKHPKIVYIARPVYIPKDVTASNEIVQDMLDSTRYGLKFYSFDSVRTIGATSWFRAINSPTKIILTPDKTVINDFTLNFGLVIAQYDDTKNKMTRISVVPYFLNTNGDYTKPISKNLLDIQYRGANLLDVPYKEPKAPDTPKHKYSLRTGFSLSANILSIGYTPFTAPAKFNWAVPSLSIGYSVVLIRNK